MMHYYLGMSMELATHHAVILDSINEGVFAVNY